MQKPQINRQDESTSIYSHKTLWMESFTQWNIFSSVPTEITHELSVWQPGEKSCSIQLACAGCVSILLLSECWMSSLTLKSLRPAKTPTIRYTVFKTSNRVLSSSFWKNLLIVASFQRRTPENQNSLASCQMFVWLVHAYSLWAEIQTRRKAGSDSN